MTNTTTNEADRILREANAILDGQHFVYISGDHGSGWVSKDVLLPYTKTISRLAALLSDAIRHIEADLICGPAVGGLVMAQWVGHHLQLPAIFTEHAAQSTNNAAMRPPFVLRRGFDKLVRSKKVLIVDDIVNTGHSIRQTAAAVRECGGNVVAAAAYCTRGNTDKTGMDVPQFVHLVEFKIPSWPADSCHLCKEGVPVNTDYAHGREFVESQKIS